MIRFFDIIFSLAGLIFGIPIFLVLSAIGFFDTGSPFFRQRRVGRNQTPFMLLKFRTMRPDTAEVATHLADASAVTPYGRFLRRTKLDELPQLWNVLKGDMSVVGPRPCLFSQEELIRCRDELRVFSARPGITGLAQVRGIDMSTPVALAETDAKMLNSLNLKEYFYVIFLTLLGQGMGDKIWKLDGI